MQSSTTELEDNIISLFSAGIKLIHSPMRCYQAKAVLRFQIPSHKNASTKEADCRVVYAEKTAVSGQVKEDYTGKKEEEKYQDLLMWGKFLHSQVFGGERESWAV